MRFKRIIIFLLLFLVFLPFLPYKEVRAGDPAKDLIEKGLTTSGAKEFLDNISKESYITYRAGEKDGYVLVDLIGRIVFIILSLLGVFFVILIIYGGYLWMTASGNEEQVSKARGMIGHAIIGLAIVLSAFAISWFVLERIGSKTLSSSTAKANVNMEFLVL